MYSNAEQSTLFDWSKSFLQQTGEVKSLDATDKVKRLSELIKYHEWRYYVKNDPIISDYEYDMLFKQLEALESEHPELLATDSPTQRVSNDLIEDFQSVAHMTPMLSLGNSYNAEDLKEFDSQIRQVLNVLENKKITPSIL